MAPERRRTRSLVDLPTGAMSALLGVGIVLTFVVVGIAARHATRPVVDTLRPVVGGNSGVGFGVGLLSTVAALLMTRWVWRRLWREVPVGDLLPWVVGVAGVVAWWTVLVPSVVLMPNVRGGGRPSAGERLVIDALPGARPGAFAGVVGTVVLWVVLDHRSARRRRGAG